jgi:4-hydroxy-tetrahydrodipicolinate reductase
MTDMRLVVVGAGGRMGSTLIRAIRETKGCVLAAAIERENHPHLGKDAGTLAGTDPLNVPLTFDALTAFARADGVFRLGRFRRARRTSKARACDRHDRPERSR